MIARVHSGTHPKNLAGLQSACFPPGFVRKTCGIFTNMPWFPSSPAEKTLDFACANVFGIASSILQGIDAVSCEVEAETIDQYLLLAKRLGMRGILLPADNAPEAAVVEGYDGT